MLYFNPPIQLQMERFWIAPLRLLAKLATFIPLDLTDLRISDAMSPYVCLRDVSYITHLLIVTGSTTAYLGPLLLTWFNFNPIMDK